jgi:L,D-transpeptidase ErfK/SrfK
MFFCYYSAIMKKQLYTLIITLLILLPTSIFASQTYTLTPGSTIIGGQTPVIIHTTTKNDSLVELARHYGIGFNEIELANPGVDAFVPGSNRQIRIPSLWILPDAPMEGIVINISEMRLYYFHPSKKGAPIKVSTFPIGIGDEGTKTPVGTWKISEKREKPSWYPPASIRAERPELPAVVPPGPENPLGTHAMRLSKTDFLIHGTHRPFGVGRLVSHGCIRLYPEHIPQLFNMVTIGTKVTIVKQPIKVGMRNNRVYVEIHEDPYIKIPNYLEAANALLQKKGLLKLISTEKLYKAVRKKDGIPFDITKDQKKESPENPVEPDFWTL